VLAVSLEKMADRDPQAVAMNYLSEKKILQLFEVLIFSSLSSLTLTDPWNEVGVPQARQSK
jgi:hypothetical protein